MSVDARKRALYTNHLAPFAPDPPPLVYTARYRRWLTEAARLLSLHTEKQSGPDPSSLSR